MSRPKPTVLLQHSNKSTFKMDEVLAALKEQAAITPAGKWVSGFGYDDTLLAENRHPTRAELDAVRLLGDGASLAELNGGEEVPTARLGTRTRCCVPSLRGAGD